MADDSPGKVQALRAIFAEKNTHVMGMKPPGGKLACRPWKTFDTIEDTVSLKEKLISDQRVSSQLITKVLPLSVNRSELNSLEPKLNVELHKAFNCSKENIKTHRPTIGPKPSYLSQQNRTSSPVNDSTQSDNSRSSDDSSTLAKSKAVADTIATFMFTNGFTHSISDLNDKNNKTSCVAPPVPVPRNLRSNQINFCNLRTSGDLGVISCNVINTDNYICKSSFRRRELPPVEQLGSPPAKPEKPKDLLLPSKYLKSPRTSDTSAQISHLHSLTSPPAASSRSAPLRPAYPCPPRPHTPPPLPPPSTPSAKSLLREEIEELYEDTLIGESRQRPVSLIPEFTEEEEADELYSDAGPFEDLPSTHNTMSAPIKPKIPLPPCPSEYLQPNVHNTDVSEEIYQDTDELGEDEEFYEEMPCDATAEDPGSPLYSNNKKEIEKLKREEEKKLRREQKDREKREKEMEKLKRKFGLTGEVEVIPIDDGLVKADSRGGRGGDLPVRKATLLEGGWSRMRRGKLVMLNLQTLRLTLSL